MSNVLVNWDEIPEVITKEQFYKICHISKSTAVYLLSSGKVPCEYSGKKTRCYKIYKSDVMEYMENRMIFPEVYSAPAGWYNGTYDYKMPTDMPVAAIENMRSYYTELLSKYESDVLTSRDVAAFTGYSIKAVNRWCEKGDLQSFRKRNINYIPKAFLLDFMCSLRFRSITRKTSKHISLLKKLSQLINEKCKQSK